MAIARRLLLDHSPAHRVWLDRVVREHGDQALLELRTRESLYESDWAGVKQWILRMPKAERSAVRWGYWLARAEQEAGRHTHAQALFQQLSYERSYYGFLAADRAGKAMPIKQSPLKIDLSWATAVKKWPALLRIRELRLLDETDLVRAEWIYLLDHVDHNQKLQLGGLALHQGWHDLAVQASIQAKAWDVLDLRFPTPMNSTFAQFAKNRDVDMSLLYALARQESALYHKARSPVGASGLMQLMPATAQATAKKIGFPLKSPAQLLDPEVNIRLGSAYLRELLDIYNGNRVLAAAAYNAGPGRVRQWRERLGGAPMDVWVESIPYRETRNYVQNVLVYNVIYQQRLRRPIQFLTRGERNLRY